MVLLQLLEKIPDIYKEICPPERTLMLRKTSKKIKEAMDNMGLKVHINIKISDCRKCYVLLKNISENYIVTKVEFMECNTYMFLDLDIIRQSCPSLTYINLCNNSFCLLSLNRFKKNLPKCKVLSCHIRPPSSMRYNFDPFHMRLDPLPMRHDPPPLRYIFDPPLDFDFDLIGKTKPKTKPMRLLKSEDKTSNKLARRAQYYNTKALNNRYHQTNPIRANCRVR